MPADCYGECYGGMHPVRRGGSANLYARYYLSREEAAVLGRSEMWRSLKTGDQREAKRRLPKALADIQARVAEAVAKSKADEITRLLAANGYGDGPWTREQLNELATVLVQHSEVVFATIGNKLALGHPDAMERTRLDMLEARTPLRQRYPDARNPLLILDTLRRQGAAPRVETLSGLLDKYAAATSAREKTKGQLRLAVNRLTAFLGSDRDPREIRRDDALGFRDWLLKQPRNRRKDGTPADDRLLSPRTVQRDCDSYGLYSRLGSTRAAPRPTRSPPFAWITRNGARSLGHAPS